MLRYIISITFLLAAISVSAQETESVSPQEIEKVSSQDTDKVKDTVPYKDRYGLRVGLDVVLPFYTFFTDDDKGFEIVGDFRFTDRFYIATELGYRDHTDQEDFYNFTTQGQYIKLGVDYNAYKNWIGMENMIVVGVRYAFSTYDYNVDEYAINADPFVPLRTETDALSYENLNAQWVEFVLGLKVEVLHNVFLGVSFRGNAMISSKDPENFKTLYVPGFGDVSFNNKGFSFNYTLSYLIPFYKK